MTKRVGVGAAQIRGALRRQIGEAALALQASDLSDEVIHDARKKLKSARAKLRLLRSAVGRAAYARENGALRDAARPLSQVRDAKAMLDVVDALRERKGAESRRLLLTALHGRLQQSHESARGEFASARCAASSAAALGRVSRRVARWQVPEDGSSSLSRGLRRVYRSARKALAAAQADCSSEKLHELRKQVKYLRESLAPFEAAGDNRAAKAIRRADKAASLLGDDHDLHVLQSSVAATESSVQLHSASLGEELVRRRAKLERRALKRSRSLLRKKPRAFAKELTRSA